MISYTGMDGKWGQVRLIRFLWIKSFIPQLVHPSSPLSHSVFLGKNNTGLTYNATTKEEAAHGRIMTPLQESFCVIYMTAL